MTTYKIVRGYFDDQYEDEDIATGLTLEQAQAHCSNPETSSSTAKSAHAVKRTKAKGSWFHRYEREAT